MHMEGISECIVNKLVQTCASSCVRSSLDCEFVDLHKQTPTYEYIEEAPSIACV